MRALITRSLARPVARRPAARHFRVAVVKVDRLGDFVLALSAIREVLNHFGEDQGLLIVSPQVEPLAAAEFPRTARLALPPAVGHRRLLTEGRKARAALSRVVCAEAVSFRHQRWDWDELMLLWLGAGRCRVLDDATRRDEFAVRNTFLFRGADRAGFAPPKAASAAWCRELWRHRQLLDATTGRTVAAEDVLPRFTRVGACDPEGGIAVLPFGSAVIRDFPEMLLHEALRAARVLTSEPITLHGDAGQRKRLLQLAARLREGGITGVNCAPPSGVVEFAEAIAGARLVLTVETSGAHLAAAFDRPAVILIGGGHYGQFGPWWRSARQIWLTVPMDCFGCGWRCIHPEPYCLTHITPKQVLAAIHQVQTTGKAPI
jgi:ADP-heptose:LPS heptosyltransferase